jgi:hypothetical protein
MPLAAVPTTREAGINGQPNEASTSLNASRRSRSPACTKNTLHESASASTAPSG